MRSYETEFERRRKRRSLLANVMIIVVAALGFFAIYTLKRYPCMRYASVAHTRFDYSLLGGCLIETRSGTWIPLHQLRGLE